MPDHPVTNRYRGNLTSPTIRKLVAFAILLSSAQVLAGGWNYGARVGLNSNYSDNPTLADEDRESDSLFKMLAAYNMDIEWSEPGRSFTIKPRVTRDYYPDSDKSELESTDYSIPGQFSVYGKKSSFNMTFDYQEQNILSSDSAVIDSFDTTNFRADDTRTRYGIGGAYTFNATERDQVFLSGTWNKSEFDLDYTGRNDNESYFFSGSYSHNLTARYKVGFGLNYSSLKSEGNNCFAVLTQEDIDNGVVLPPSLSFDPCQNTQVNINNKSETNNYSATLNFSAQLTPNTGLKLKYGQQTSDSKSSVKTTDGMPIYPETDSDQDGETYNFALDGQFERYTYNFSAGRKIKPSQQGSAQNTTTLTLRQQYDLSEKLTGIFSLRGSERESVLSESDDTNLGSRKTRTFEADTKVQWKINRVWSVSLLYAYRYRNRDSVPERNIEETTASSNRINFGITYIIKPKQR
jgi:hypothetical protein